MGRVRSPTAILGVALVLTACARSGNPLAPTQPADAPALTATSPAAAAPAPLTGSGAVAATGPAAQTTQAAPGVKVFLDPVTGEAREPTPAEAAGAAASGHVQREAVGGQAGSEGTQREHFLLPDGTEGVKLAPRDKRAVVVCLQADGSFSENCPPAASDTRP